MKWLSVKKHNPPDNVDVLVKNKNDSKTFAFFDPEYGWRDFWRGLTMSSYPEVTHFCIPDPIEGEEE